MTRKDKKALKRREREAMKGGMDGNDLLADIADIGEFEEYASLQREAGGPGPVREEDEEEVSLPQGRASSNLSLKALKKASKRLGKQEEADDEDHDSQRFRAMLEQSNPRRKAPPVSMEVEVADDPEEDEAEDLLASFAKRKKEWKEEREALHSMNKVPRYGGEDRVVEEGDKRLASRTILKNRGLVPHRNKEAKNPRVKKRLAYQKAVVARKGQVRDVVTPTAAYGGEMTGIKANLSRSRRMDA